MTEKNNDCLRLVKLGPEHIEEVRKALDTCARVGAQPWNADVNDYPGCMIDGGRSEIRGGMGAFR